jgi:hypothetical protein
MIARKKKAPPVEADGAKHTSKVTEHNTVRLLVQELNQPQPSDELINQVPGFYDQLVLRNMRRLGLTNDQRLAIAIDLLEPILREQGRQRQLEGLRKARETQARVRAAGRRQS